MEILRYDDMLHGFLMFVGYIDTTDLALRDTAEAINSALARSAAQDSDTKRSRKDAQPQ